MRGKICHHQVIGTFIGTFAQEQLFHWDRSLEPLRSLCPFIIDYTAFIAPSHATMPAASVPFVTRSRTRTMAALVALSKGDRPFIGVRLVSKFSRPSRQPALQLELPTCIASIACGGTLEVETTE
jgi:hypothetical protein